MSLKYNTQQKKMALPEYGRSIQNMVDYAITIKDKEERQWCANTIIDIMGNMFPLYRDVPEFKHKLWDHLAIMSDYKLDIDYPYEIVPKESLHMKPNHIPYSNHHMRYRHYGKTLEKLIKVASDMEDGDEKDNLVALICNHMRKDYLQWNKDGMDDQKVADDLNELSRGKLKFTEETKELMLDRIEAYCKPKASSQNNPSNQGGKPQYNRNNNKRKY